MVPALEKRIIRLPRSPNLCSQAQVFSYISPSFHGHELSVLGALSTVSLERKMHTAVSIGVPKYAPILRGFSPFSLFCNQNEHYFLNSDFLDSGRHLYPCSAENKRDWQPS